MLIHPQFDPAALRIGSFAIHWYGLMYLMAFAQFLLLGRLRIRNPRYEAMGWTYKDLEDLLLILPINVRILGEEYAAKDFTGKQICLSRGIEVYFNKREHSFSTTELRQRIHNKEKAKETK